MNDFVKYQSILDYNPDTGVIIWKFRDSSTHYGKIFNSRYGGKPLRYNNGDGYIKARISGKSYYAHRLAWLLYYGEWPKYQLDHINGCRSDNRICNLRDVTDSINRKNSKLRRDSSSGIAGVYWHKQCNKWHARIKHNGRTISLGLFDTLEAATEVRKSAEVKYGYHENHGRS